MNDNAEISLDEASSGKWFALSDDEFEAITEGLMLLGVACKATGNDDDEKHITPLVEKLVDAVSIIVLQKDMTR
jgi:hypothetical protein